MDARDLEDALSEEFDGTEAERQVIAREARDLSDSGKPKRDRGHALTASDVLSHLSDAPDDSTLVDRWNWWMSALDTAYGGYHYFTVRVVEGDEEAGINR